MSIPCSFDMFAQYISQVQALGAFATRLGWQRGDGRCELDIKLEIEFKLFDTVKQPVSFTRTRKIKVADPGKGSLDWAFSITLTLTACPPHLPIKAEAPAL